MQVPRYVWITNLVWFTRKIYEAQVGTNLQQRWLSINHLVMSVGRRLVPGAGRRVEHQAGDHQLRLLGSLERIVSVTASWPSAADDAAGAAPFQHCVSGSAAGRATPRPCSSATSSPVVRNQVTRFIIGPIISWLSSGFITDLFRCHLVDTVIGEEHDGARYPEGNTRRDDGVDFVDNELAPVRMLGPIFQMLVCRVPSRSMTHCLHAVNKNSQRFHSIQAASNTSETSQMKWIELNCNWPAE